MTKTTFYLIASGYYIFAIVLIIGTLSLMNKNKRNDYSKTLYELEKYKNLTFLDKFLVSFYSLK